MKEYKRLTTRDRYGKVYYSTTIEADNIREIYNEINKKDKEIMYRLAELEDKIENKTLIEIDHSLIGEEIIGIKHYTDGTYQLDLDENIVIGFAIDGVITWNGTHHFNDEFRNGMFFIDNEKGRAEAEKKFKELQNER